MKHTEKQELENQKQMINIMKMLPENIANQILLKQFKKQTKILNKLPNQNQEKQITKLQKPITKKIKYKEQTTYKWLEELKKINKKPSQTELQFINWYQTEYPIISIQTIMKTQTKKQIK